MEAQRDRVWVEIATTQQVVEVGLRTILGTADAPFEITTRGPVGDEPDVVLFDVIHSAKATPPAWTVG